MVDWGCQLRREIQENSGMEAFPQRIIYIRIKIYIYIFLFPCCFFFGVHVAKCFPGTTTLAEATSMRMKIDETPCRIDQIGNPQTSTCIDRCGYFIGADCENRKEMK